MIINKRVSVEHVCSKIRKLCPKGAENYLINGN